MRSKATFKSARQRGVVQSGSVYHVAHADGSADGFQGFNLPFTLEGLGYERQAGIVGGYCSYSGASEAAGQKAMFDGVWDNPSLVADVTDEVASQIGTLYRENAPELVYFLTLYHVFRDFMEQMALLSRLRDSQSENNVLRSRYRDKEATLAEPSRLRMELRKAERARDGIADEIKELCRG